MEDLGEGNGVPKEKYIANLHNGKIDCPIMVGHGRANFPTYDGNSNHTCARSLYLHTKDASDFACRMWVSLALVSNDGYVLIIIMIIDCKNTTKTTKKNNHIKHIIIKSKIPSKIAESSRSSNNPYKRCFWAELAPASIGGGATG